MITLGSLFDGIGGFPLAGRRVGIVAKWASEIESFPMKVAAIRFPDMEQKGDITKINGAGLEPVDIVTFGFPCQDLSVAGKRAGFEGTRSILFYEAVRIIREMRSKTNGIYPRFAIFENVPGLFSHQKGETFRKAIEEMCKICDETIAIPGSTKGKWNTAGCIMGNGYSIAWRILDAQYWGVPQRRRRIFLVADFGGQSAPEVLFKRKGLSRHLAESGEAREGITGDVERGAGETSGTNYLNGWDCQRYRVATTDSVCPTLDAGDGGGGHGVNILTTVIPINDKAARHMGGGQSRNHDDSGNGLGVGKPGDPCPTLTAGDKHGVAVLPFNATQITSPANGNNPKYGDPCHPLCATDYAPHIVHQINCQPSGIAGTVSSKWAKGTGGPAGDEHYNLVCRPLRAQAQHSYREDSDNVILSPTLDATMNDKWGSNQWVDQYAEFMSHYSVRRLTPLECERLQDYPDGWTDIPGASDSGRYKALGNSVAVCCPEYVLEGIKEVLEAAL